MGSFTERNNLALPLAHHIPLAQELGGVSCRELKRDLWNCLGDTPGLGGVTQNLLQFIVSSDVFRPQFRDGFRVGFLELAKAGLLIRHELGEHGLDLRIKL